MCVHTVRKGIDMMKPTRTLLLAALIGLTTACTGPGYKADLPLDKRFPYQQVTLILGGKVGTYNCYVDHEQQSLYLCDEIVKGAPKDAKPLPDSWTVVPPEYKRVQ